ncbi:uncharacterized protein LOC131688422 [Topomyia yanbarensis]|uniref:uncharacterized protein LOC131688422 n=1 Tax=Topomyia yanbarensis TaxID=2498891 RepID=UPI00273B0C2F|nr:uncharacterized protein LOC131688422 [Topomyia yanbarensis]
MQWLAFHDTFLALIHLNLEVPDIQKFHYLRAAVKGEAVQLIESIGISSFNYVLAWQTLENRYSNDYLLKKRHVQALFDDSLKAWEDHASTVANPDYACLIEFLQRRTRVLESISVNHHTVESASTSGISAHPPKKNHLHSQFRFTSCASTASLGEKCIACNQSHSVTKCQKFNRISPSERQQLVNSKRLCHNCLKGDHFVRNCPSNFSCRKCNRRHHTLLHSGQSDGSRKNVSEGASSSPGAIASTTPFSGSSVVESSTQFTVAATENVPVDEVSSALQHPREDVFLLTVIVMVIDTYGVEHLARALLDSASQPNLITDRMAQILRLRRQPVNVTVQGAGKLSKPAHESVFA